MITLYGFGESGHSFKVAQMLNLTGLAWRLQFVPFFNGGTRTPDFRRLNEMGECPVLVDGDLVLSQSGVILDFLVEKTGQYGGQTAADRREVLRWVLWDNHKFSAPIGLNRFLMNFLAAEKRVPEVIAFHQARIKSAFVTLETHLASRDWIAADHPTIADLSCCSYLYYPEPWGVSPGDYPAISGWLARLSALPGWKHPYDLMPRAFPPAN